MRSLVLLSLAAPLLVIPVRPADACSAPRCWPGAFVPADNATIPANAPALYWRPARDLGGEVTPDPASVSLTTVDDPDTQISFTATALPSGDFVLALDEPLVPGTRYVLEDLATCGDEFGPRVGFLAAKAEYEYDVTDHVCTMGTLGVFMSDGKATEACALIDVS
ncbi:MAG: hypothetical protein H0T89_19355 [Deltaproteobacteria bacterium]|nr:hypothetical protein [Deltaproteobacteria bacterium]MDQ3365738.1 hypothetical protein [Myxococcota bacterium]